MGGEAIIRTPGPRRTQTGPTRSTRTRSRQGEAGRGPLPLPPTVRGSSAAERTKGLAHMKWASPFDFIAELSVGRWTAARRRRGTVRCSRLGSRRAVLR